MVERVDIAPDCILPFCNIQILETPAASIRVGLKIGEFNKWIINSPPGHKLGPAYNQWHMTSFPAAANETRLRSALATPVLLL